MILSDEERKLIEKLKLVENLFAGTTYDGERAAAAEALKRLKQQLASFQREEKPSIHQFSIQDPWARKLFMALLRRYDIKPFRYPRQRYTTVLARMPASFLNQILWPEFVELERVLRAHLEMITERVIHEAIHANSSEAEVREEQETRKLQ